MIRGAQKKMIVLRTHNSRMFEEAYFVMRHDAKIIMSDEALDPCRHNDILHEANRILEGSLAGCSAERAAREKHRRRLMSLFWFVGGVILGCFVTGVLWAVIG